MRCEAASIPALPELSTMIVTAASGVAALELNLL